MTPPTSDLVDLLRRSTEDFGALTRGLEQFPEDDLPNLIESLQRGHADVRVLGERLAGADPGDEAREAYHQWQQAHDTFREAIRSRMGAIESQLGGMRKAGRVLRAYADSLDSHHTAQFMKKKI